jgi:hypothetical protein
MLRTNIFVRLRKALRHKTKKEESFGNATNLLIKITCPMCGGTCVGSAAEVVAWRAEHRCRPSERPKGLRVLPEHAG